MAGCGYAIIVTLGWLGATVHPADGGWKKKLTVHLLCLNTAPVGTNFKGKLVTAMQNVKTVVETIDEIFHPRSIAVVGASPNKYSFGYQYLHILLNCGYRGRLYPVNPRGGDILGVHTYTSLTEIPGDVDYVICCINAVLVPDLLPQCARKKVKAVHLFTAKLSETGDLEARRLERAITEQARQLGIRLIGPNCVGFYNPAWRIAFNHDLCLEPGSVGAIMQSGGLAGEIVRQAALRGVRFSKAVSYGNAADLNETDFLEYFLWDRETKVILMYIEGVQNGRAFFNALRSAAKIKPIIILKGGRSKAGGRSVASHTASIAGSMDTWQMLFRQTKAVQARSLNDLLDLAVAFALLPPVTGKRVGLVGGGGGKSVLACDEFEEAGLEVAPFPEKVIKFLESKSPGITRWLVNPIDISILSSVNLNAAEIIECMADSAGFDLLGVNLTDDSLFWEDPWREVAEREMHGCLLCREKQKPAVAVVNNPEIGVSQVENWRWQALFEYRERLVNAGIPVFSSPGRAATAVNKLVDYYLSRQKQGIGENLKQKTGNVEYLKSEKARGWTAAADSKNGRQMPALNKPEPVKVRLSSHTGGAGVLIHKNPEEAESCCDNNGVEAWAATPSVMAELAMPGVMENAKAKGRYLKADVVMPGIMENAKAHRQRALTEVEAKEALRAAGIPVVETHLVTTREEAQRISARLGFPVVLKICSADIIHKTEHGGVCLNLASTGAVGEAYDRLLKTARDKNPAAKIAGVTVQKMIRGGMEVVAGMARDPQFGPLIMFGLGGIFVEILKDVSFRIVPLTEKDAAEMLTEIKGQALLEGARGTNPVNKKALTDILLKLSRFIEENPEIEELDINPIIADGQGAVAVDARIILAGN